MIANYHTHTWRCHHASGQEREYVEQAIRSGLKILGFSDHAPVPFRNYESTVRMLPSQLEDYVSTLSALKEEYRHDIEIHIGLEAEYYPDLFDEQMEMFSAYPIEYLLLGQHFIGNEVGAPYCGHPTDREDILRSYCSQCIRAMKTGKYHYLAHPDLIYYTGDPSVYRQAMTSLCITAKELDIPLEINLLGIQIHRHYPNAEFWKIAGAVGNRVILGSDAHAPQDVTRAAALEKAKDYIDRNHLTLIEVLPIPGREDL